MFSLTMEVTCFIIHPLALATVLDTDERSVLKWNVWLLPEITDMFQTTVGCTGSGLFRQDSSFAPICAEEDIANV